METPVKTITMVKCSHKGGCDIQVKKPDGFKGNNLLCPEHRPKKPAVEKAPVAEKPTVEKAPVSGKKIIASPTSFKGTCEQHAELERFTAFLNTLDKSSQNFIVGHYRKEVPKFEKKTEKKAEAQPESK